MKPLPVRRLRGACPHLSRSAELLLFTQKFVRGTLYLFPTLAEISGAPPGDDGAPGDDGLPGRLTRIEQAKAGLYDLRRELGDNLTGIKGKERREAGLTGIYNR
ncbi:MAG: hypothetical protein LBF62_10000 [Tannerellaceae bacterium]|nr:hypothetical protein [Tannerellaceae bacterium]